MPQTKRCSRCNLSKPTTEFYSDGRTKDGLSYQCKPCKIDTVRLSQNRNIDKNTQTLAQRQRELLYWYAENLPTYLTPHQELQMHTKILKDLSIDDPRIQEIIGWEPPPQEHIPEVAPVFRQGKGHTPEQLREFQEFFDTLPGLPPMVETDSTQETQNKSKDDS